MGVARGVRENLIFYVWPGMDGVFGEAALCF